MLNRTRVLIVDDHPLFRRGMRDSLEQYPELLVIGEAGDGETAVQLADSLSPNVILMDINLPRMNGLETTRAIRKRRPDISVVMVSMHEDDEQLFNAIRAGAAAYCTKDVDSEHLASTVRRVGQGEYLINDNVLARPQVASRVLNEFRELSSSDQPTATFSTPLTPREVEILDCVAQGNSNKEIASRLHISDQTVKNHITSILRKLAVNDRTQAVLFALRHGWIRLDDDRLGRPQHDRKAS